MHRWCTGVELLTKCLPSPLSPPESRLSSVFYQHSPLQFKLRGTERRRGQNDGHCVIRLRLLRPRTILLQERKSLAIFLTLLWVLHFIFDRREKSTEMFGNFFYVLLGFLLFCFVSEGRSGTIYCRKSNWTLPHPSVTKFAFNCS